MEVTPALVRAQREWLLERTPEILALVNETRSDLGEQFGTAVDPVDAEQVEAAIADVFADGDRAVNAAALVAILRDLDVTADYPGFVVDELLGRELAGTIAGEQPLRLLAEATFHYADVVVQGGSEEAAGIDDLDAAVAAGLQTRLPGWEWRRGESPFAVDLD